MFMPNGQTDFDAIVLGLGPAGLQAAIYLARAKHSVLAIGNPKASGLYMAHKVENYFGIQSITGPDIMAAGIAQARGFGAGIEEGEVVAIKRIPGDVAKDRQNFSVETSTGKHFTAKAVLICTGSKKASAGIPKEKDYVGKGLGYCAACDAYFFKKKSVAVIGSRDYAVHEALELARHASQVTIFTQLNEPQFSEFSKQQIADNKITVRQDKIVEILGAPFLNEIKVRKADGIEANEPIGGVFVAVGTASSADMARLVGAEAEGNYVKIDSGGRTTATGVFAAGDCTGGRLQLATSVGQGANAAFAAMEFIRGSAPKIDWG